MASPDAGAPPAVDPAWLVHAEADLLVLAKPAGLLCQPGLGPALADSLISRVQRQWPSAQLVHRLDRDTSGLLLVALSPALHRALSGLFAARRVHKRYDAVVHGRPQQPAGCIELALAKRQQRPPLYGPDPAGKPCRTSWRLLASAPAPTPHQPPGADPPHRPLPPAAGASQGHRPSDPGGPPLWP